jgi:hypothetical protein
MMRNFGQSQFGEMLFSEEGLEKVSKNPSVLASFFILTYGVSIFLNLLFIHVMKC